ncbi:MAG: YggS family pyridoxal phosphate-dependent enzyme [Deltaproteobacteria bacterium]|nr:YggS family pyridoxal phosphate-dependent enzyme [Deltaproteobacteria bacterium]
MIAENLRAVQERIAAAARRTGRDPARVRLLAVTKGVDQDRLRQAVAAGQLLLGENYLQEAREKIRALGPQVCWHFIGHLQTNKARAAVDLFHMIHSVDRLRLAQALNDAAGRLGKVQEVLLQVNLAGEESKSGAAPKDVPDLLAALVGMPHLKVSGLMAIPPWLPEAEEVRPYFRALRELRDRLAEQGLTADPLPELSMGMSGDFEVAVEEGATLVRLGALIFGPRPPKP